jgi:hypothetical protein
MFLKDLDVRRSGLKMLNGFDETQREIFSKFDYMLKPAGGS